MISSEFMLAYPKQPDTQALLIEVKGIKHRCNCKTFQCCERYRNKTGAGGRMNETLLEVKEISKHFGGVKALDKVNLSIKKGEIHCLVGENGCGKSTD